MVQAPLSSRSVACAWDPYLFHLFEVIVQLGALSPANLLADQLLGRRKEACEGTGGGPAVPAKDAASGCQASAGVYCDSTQHLVRTVHFSQLLG